MSIQVALAGNPNCGKTTLFNGLTGATQYVGNWPGVTVEKKEGKYKEDKDVIDRKTYYVRCALEDDIFYLYINSMLGLKCRELGDGKIEVKVLRLQIDKFTIYNGYSKSVYPIDVMNYMVNKFIITQKNDILSGWSR